MKRNYIKHSENVIGFTLEGVSLNNIVTREVSPVDDFYFETTISSDDGCECVGFTDPIRMLFNQQRLSRIGSTAVESWLAKLQNFKADPLAELRLKCSDEDLKTMIKSRNLQQPSEILQWCQYMQSNMDEFQSEVSKLIAQKESESRTGASSDAVDNTNTQ